jgi:hypothetical protein
MRGDFSAAIESIRALERGLEAAAKEYSSLGVSQAVPPFLEPGAAAACRPSENFSGRVAAVDGGIVSAEYQSSKLSLHRAVCAVFEYEKGRVVKNAYRPAKIEGGELSVSQGFDEGAQSAQEDSIMRLASEIARAKEAIDLFSPALLFLDGSIFPNPSDRPAKESALHPAYESMLSGFRALFSSARHSSIVLCGIVKDSKSRIFLDAMRRSPAFSDFFKKHSDALEKTNDSAFFSLALQCDSRTPLLHLERHDLPRDMLGTTPAVTYLKAAKFDRPVRIEFADAAQAADAAAHISALCKGNERYAYPAVLIEADLRAALDPRELEAAYAQLCTKLGFETASLRKLRRNERPFR